MADYYTTGSVQLTNGSKAVTGIDTAWAIAQVAGGTIFVEAEGNALPLASIQSDTAATAALEWTGATGTYSYALLRATAFSEQLETNSNIMSRILVAMEAGTLYRYDVAGDTADLPTYDERPKGFAFLAIDVDPAELYIKASATSGDWEGPFSYGTGPAGPAPAIGFEPVVTGAPGSNAGMVVTGSGEPGDPYEITFTIPAGAIGVNPRGAYSGATAYAVRDVVLNNGSSWVALQATTGNAPPVLPATANDYWQLVAAKGTDGTGTGDVVGPAGATAGRVAAFSGTTGKAIADSGKLVSDLVTGPAVSVDGALVAYDGVTGKVVKALTNAQAKIWLASTALDVSFSNATANLPGSPATVQAAINALAASTGGGKNDALLALEIADLKGQRIGMVGGVADAFDDETGVNTSGSTNQSYNASADTYSPTSTPGADQTATHTGLTASGNTVSASSQFDASFPPWKAFDKITGSAGQANCWISITSTGWIQYQFATAKTIAQYTVRSANGFAARAPSAWTLQGSGTGAFSGEETILDTRTGQTAWASGGEVRSFAVASPGSFAYYRIVVTAINGDPNLVIDEITYLVAGVYNNMTLLSVAYTAASQPTTGRMALQLVETDSITINTDVIGEISRDGGTTLTAVALALSTNLGGAKVYEGVANISAQPAGTSMKWRVRTLNNKNVAVSGVVMQWS